MISTKWLNEEGRYLPFPVPFKLRLFGQSIGQTVSDQLTISHEEPHQKWTCAVEFQIGQESGTLVLEQLISSPISEWL